MTPAIRSGASQLDDDTRCKFGRIKLWLFPGSG